MASSDLVTDSYKQQFFQFYFSLFFKNVSALMFVKWNYEQESPVTFQIRKHLFYNVDGQWKYDLF